MDYKPFTPFSDENIDGHMLFGMTGRQCQTTIVNGKDPDAGPGAGRTSTRKPENAHILESSQKALGRAEPQRILMTLANSLDFSRFEV
ncbi:MAG: hypothetical protein ACLSHO_09270 [Dysosmobacter sp.]